MSDKPIIFSTPMIKALLAGLKTQTRRVHQVPDGLSHLAGSVSPRIKVGDRLWVRESFLPDPSADSDAWDDWTCSYVEWSGTGCKASQVPPALRSARNVIYKADTKWDDVPLTFTSCRFMPRWASRVTLTVTDVRVQRLQDISGQDAIAEGCVPAGWVTGKSAAEVDEIGRDAYANLWEQINGLNTWAANPWVAAYTFTVARGNIDSMPHADGYSYTPLGREDRGAG